MMTFCVVVVSLQPINMPCAREHQCTPDWQVLLQILCVCNSCEQGCCSFLTCSGLSCWLLTVLDSI